jgi:hypothetical protein
MRAPIIMGVREINCRRRACTAAFVVLLVLGLEPGATALAGGTVTGAIKISVPAHIALGKAYRVTVSGDTSHPKSGVMMVAQRTRCSKDVTKVPGNAGIVIPGLIVSGHFRHTDRLPHATPSHGAVNYCAYLFYAPAPAYNTVTIAYGTARYRIPS